MSVLGYLDGRPLPRAELDRRLAALRAGPRAGVLPAPGSPEDRQLTRWVAQVVLTERLCEAEAAARGLATDDTRDRLDQRAAVELGSIVAAAYEGSAAVRAVYTAVTERVTVPEEDVRAYRAATARPVPPRWRVALDDDPAPQVFTADELPAALAEALRGAAPGDTVTAAGWTVRLLATLPAEPPGHDASGVREKLLAAARRVTFVRWLDRARAARIALVPGLEHPGDPRQPDNHHRH